MAPVNPHKTQWGKKVLKFEQCTAYDLFGIVLKKYPCVISFAFATDDLLYPDNRKAIAFWQCNCVVVIVIRRKQVIL